MAVPSVSEELYSDVERATETQIHIWRSTEIDLERKKRWRHRNRHGGPGAVMLADGPVSEVWRICGGLGGGAGVEGSGDCRKGPEGTVLKDCGACRERPGGGRLRRAEGTVGEVGDRQPGTDRTYGKWHRLKRERQLGGLQRGDIEIDTDWKIGCWLRDA